VVNKVGLPHVALPTLLSFSCSHAFRVGGPKIIWDSHSSNMEKPTVVEKEQATGFHIGTIVVQSISKRACRQILGQVMDLNYLTWIFQFGRNKTKTFCQFTPTHSTPSFTCCTSCWVSYVFTKGGDVTIRQTHPCQLLDQGHQGRFMGVEQKLIMWGRPKMVAPPCILHNNHKPSL
jgi:hypothetical protein